MKIIIIVIALILSINSYSQTYPKDSVNAYGDKDTIAMNNIETSALSTVMTYSKSQEKVIIYRMENGNIYYTPSFFCDCDKCKNFKGLKKLK